MRAGRILLAVAALVLLAAVGVLLLAPSLLDWNRYRDEIAELASSGIGRPVQITGNVSLSLLPEPVLTAADMTVADSGDGITLRAEALRLRVSLGALLAGRIDARELVLRGADLHLPWPPAPGALAQRPPSWLSGLQARLENSRLQVGGIVFTDIAANLSTDPDTGTLSANGSGKLGGQGWRVIARLSEPGRDGSAALDASIDGEDRLRDTGGTFSGQIGPDGALAGRATGRGSDLSLLLPAPSLPWSGEGRLSAAAGLAVADELQMVLAGVPARGAVALRVQPEARLDVALASNRLDLDAWWPVLLRGAAPSLPTGVDLSAEAATFAGGQLRRVRVGLDLGPAGTVVREAAAELPGQAALTLAGSAGRDGGFHGTARLAAPDLRATLGWLEPSVPGLAAMRPDSALRTGQIAADVAAENGVIGLTGLKGVLDGAPVTGSASFRPGARPALTGDLRFERLVLDPWLPNPRFQDALPRLARRFAAFDLALRVQAVDATWQSAPVSSASLDMTADNGRIAVRKLAAAVGGIRLTLSGNLADARLLDGALDVSADDAAPLAGLLPPPWTPLAPLLRGPATLTVRGAGPLDALVLHVVAEASDVHVDAAPVVDPAGGKLSGPVTLHHPGAPRLLRMFGLQELAEAVGDGSMSFLAQLSAEPGAFRFDPFQLSAASARMDGQVAVELTGGISITGRIGAESLPLSASLFRSGDLLPTAYLEGWRAKVQLEAARVTVANRSVMTGAGAGASLADGVLTLANGTATVAGAPVTFEAKVDSRAEPPAFAARGAIAGAALPGAPAAGEPGPGESSPGASRVGAPVSVGPGTLDAQFALQATGHGTAALLSTLNGQFQVSVRDGILHGLDLPGASAAAGAKNLPLPMVLSAVRAALTGGSGAFAQLEGTVAVDHGQAAVTNGTLADSAGAATVSGTAYLPAGTVDLRIARPATGEAPGFAVRLTGPFPDIVATPELAGLARELAEAAASAPASP